MMHGKQYPQFPNGNPQNLPTAGWEQEIVAGAIDLINAWFVHCCIISPLVEKRYGFKIVVLQPSPARIFLTP